VPGTSSSFDFAIYIGQEILISLKVILLNLLPDFTEKNKKQKQNQHIPVLSMGIFYCF
jgi:hypothetical protein